MDKPDLGTKRKCLECGVPFYDLNKKQIECPKCGATFNPAPPPRRRRPTAKPAETPATVAPEKTKDLTESNGEDVPDEVVLDDDDDGDDDLIEDTSDLGEDDDDMSEVKEHIDDGVEDKL